MSALMRKMIGIVGLICILAGGQIAHAQLPAPGDDDVDANLNFQGVHSFQIVAWALDDEGELFSWTTRGYHADTKVGMVHVETSTNDLIPHIHYESEWPAATVADATRYWEERFGVGNKTTAAGNAQMKSQTCYEWAFATSSRSTGTYDYTISYSPTDYIAHVFNEDFDGTLGDNSQVRANDVIHYNGHATLAHEVRLRQGENDKWEPSVLKWKWLDSPIITYNVPQDHEANDAYRTPGCHNTTTDENDDLFGDVEVGKTPAQKGWSWDSDLKAVFQIWTTN